jgi:plasmid maintenance system antidote protein VapI|nr:MAG TPA: Regulatory protein [Caudoviricetes sp.]
MTTKAKSRYVLNKKALQHYLIDHDLTQADFAKTLGISTSYFNELMNGKKAYQSATCSRLQKRRIWIFASS